MLEITENDLVVKRSLINQYISGKTFLHLCKLMHTGTNKLTFEEKNRLLKEKIMPENEIYYKWLIEDKTITYEQFHNGSHKSATLEEINEYRDNTDERIFEFVGSGSNRCAFRCGEYVFKIALDHRLAPKDNKREMFYSKKLQPYVTKVYECTKNGLLSVQEYVRTLTEPELYERRGDMLAILETLSKDYMFGDVGVTKKNVSNWGVRRDDDESLCILDFAYTYKVDSSKFECPNGCIDHDTGNPVYLEYSKDYYNLTCRCCNGAYAFNEFIQKVDNAELEIETKEVERKYNLNGETKVSKTVICSNMMRKDEKGNDYKVYDEEHSEDIYYHIHKPSEEVVVSKTIDTIEENEPKPLSAKKKMKLILEKEKLERLRTKNYKKYEAKIREMSDKKFDLMYNGDLEMEDNEDMGKNKNKRKVKKVEMLDLYEDYSSEELIEQNDAFMAGEITRDEWLSCDMSNWIPGVKVEDRDSYTGDVSNEESDYIPNFEDVINGYYDNIDEQTSDEVDQNEQCNQEQEELPKTQIVNTCQTQQPRNEKQSTRLREIHVSSDGVNSVLNHIVIGDDIGSTTVKYNSTTIIEKDLTDGKKCMDISSYIMNYILTKNYPSVILSITEYNNVVNDRGVDPERIKFIKFDKFVLCYLINKKDMNKFNMLISKNSESLKSVMNIYSEIAYKYEFYNTDNATFELTPDNIQKLYSSKEFNNVDAFVEYFKKVRNNNHPKAICYDYDKLVTSFIHGMYYLTDDGYFIDDTEQYESVQETEENQESVDLSIPVISNEVTESIEPEPIHVIHKENTSNDNGTIGDVNIDIGNEVIGDEYDDDESSDDPIVDLYKLLNDSDFSGDLEDDEYDDE